MELDDQLRSLLRVPQDKGTDKMVVLSCRSPCDDVQNLMSSEAFSIPPCVHTHKVILQRRADFGHTNQIPPKPPSKNATRKIVSKRRRWDINTIIGHILLVVFHLMQWRKISQTKGVSAETLEEELD